jgi:hypothetical protein
MAPMIVFVVTSCRRNSSPKTTMMTNAIQKQVMTAEASSS